MDTLRPEEQSTPVLLPHRSASRRQPFTPHNAPLSNPLASTGKNEQKNGKGKMQTTMHGSINKENNTGGYTRSVQRATPASFRRTLRATVSPPRPSSSQKTIVRLETASTKGKNTFASLLTTPHVPSVGVPKTPKSFLQQHVMNSEDGISDNDDDLDDSLLVSPSADFLSKRLAKTSSVKRGQKPQSTSAVLPFFTPHEEGGSTCKEISPEPSIGSEFVQQGHDVNFLSPLESVPEYSTNNEAECGKEDYAHESLKKTDTSQTVELATRRRSLLGMHRKMEGLKVRQDKTSMMGAGVQRTTTDAHTLEHVATRNEVRESGVCLDLSSLFLGTTNENGRQGHGQNIHESMKKNPSSSEEKEISSSSSIKAKGLSKLPGVGAFAEVSNKKSTSMTPTGGVAFTISLNASPRVDQSSTKAPSSKSKDFLTATEKRKSKSDSWAERQCKTFAEWLNFTLNPLELDESDNANATASSSSAFKTLVFHQTMAKTRVKAAELFMSDEMAQVRQTIQAEIGRGRLAIRSDHDLYADLSLRKEITNLLMSYTTPWLRLGLEVIFGETIPPDMAVKQEASDTKSHSSVQRVRSQLRDFIVQRILYDASVLSKYTKGKCKIPSGKFEKKYRAEMRSLTLYRLMVLVLFMDRAKVANILDKVPRLFIKGSAVKSSKALLQSLCRVCLTGEGDFLKHLNRLGLTVSYRQLPVDEVEFSVDNLASDLRDGVRLTRMAEVITGCETKILLSTLRLPAVSRLQKLHNVGVSIKQLKSYGIAVPDDVDAHHIVDGHREVVLKLMWAVISHDCMHKLLQSDLVEQEVQNVLRSNRARLRVQGNFFTAYGKEMSPMNRPAFDASPEVKLHHLLFRWCKAVCSCFGLEITNLTTSFADGRALCFLVHYYHPGLLGMPDILPTNRESCKSDDEVIKNERHNSSLARKISSELGGIPKILPSVDHQHPPSQQTVLLCLSFLCSRLMESSKEILATILIQAYYRKYREKVLLERKISAAHKILSTWRVCRTAYYRNQKRKYHAQVEAIENFVLNHRDALVRLRAERLRGQNERNASIKIQSTIRGFLGRVAFSRCLRDHRASIVLQAQVRGFLAKLEVSKRLLAIQAARTIQSCWRGYFCRVDFVERILCAIDIQRVFRGFAVRRKIQHQRVSAFKIQKVWRKFCEDTRQNRCARDIQRVWRGLHGRRSFVHRLQQRYAAIAIQSQWRSWYSAITYQIKRESAVVIQKSVRGFLSRRNQYFTRQKNGAVAIQKIWRGFLCQVQYNLDLMDIVAIQSVVRRHQAMIEKRRRKMAVIKLQSSLRCCLARRLVAKHRHTHRMAVMIQAMWKKRTQSHRYEAAKHAVVVLQSVFRGRRQRTLDLLQTRAAVHIQRAWRYTVSCRQLHWSLAVVRAVCLGYAVRKRYQKLRQSAVHVQKVWKTAVTKQKWRRQRTAVLKIQTSWRRFVAQLNYNLDVLEIIIAQSVVRKWRARRMAIERRHAVRVLQGALRSHLAQVAVSQLREQKKQEEQLLQATLRLEAFIRGKREQVKFQRAKKSIILLQARCRGMLQQASYAALRRRLVLLQAHIRSRQIRMQVQSLHANATVVQASWRGFVQAVSYQMIIRDVIVVQSLYRKQVATEKFAARQQAVGTLQRFARRSIAIRCVCHLKLQRDIEQKIRSRSAVSIQSTVRRYLFARMYARKLSAIVKMQSMARRSLARSHLRRCNLAATQIQLVAKSYFARSTLANLRIVREQARRQRKAAEKFQAAYRGYRVRQVLATLHKNSTIIQARFRMYKARVAYQVDLIDVLLVQACVRRWLAIRHTKRCNTAAISIQCLWRKIQSTTLVQALVASKRVGYCDNKSATDIQRVWRGRVGRMSSSKEAAARRIQKTWRCYTVHVDYIILLLGVISVQSTARAWIAKRRYNNALEHIVRIQALTRGYLLRRQVRSWNSAAIKIQSLVRRDYYRRQFEGTMVAAVAIQKVVRGHLARVDRKVQHFAATEIQRIWRGYNEFADYIIALVSVVRIQSIFRMRLAQKQYERLWLARWAKKCYVNWQALKIQRVFKAYKMRLAMEHAASTIQALARAFLRKRFLSRVDRGVKRLQAVYRGICIRQVRPKSIVKVANRVIQAGKRARADPKQRLGYRTRAALQVLQTSTRLSEILAAMSTLEATTRLSSVCCEVFAKTEAIEILLALIRSCNRSLPHLELLHSILTTLHNCAVYERLTPRMSTAECAEVLMDLIQMFRDKDPIFCLSVALLWKVIKCRKEPMDLCASKESVKRLKGVLNLSRRKAKGIPTVRQKTVKHPDGLMDLQHGVHTLHNVVRYVESKKSGTSPQQIRASSSPKHFKF